MICFQVVYCFQLEFNPGEKLFEMYIFRHLVVYFRSFEVLILSYSKQGEEYKT